MFLCPRGSIGSYWPTKEQVKIAVVSFSSFSDVWENKHPFICVCFGSLTYLNHMILDSPFFPYFLHFFYQHFICSPILINPPSFSPLVCRIHPSRQRDEPFPPVVVCVVLVMARHWLAWRKMRPLCMRWTVRGQLSNVSGFQLETWKMQRTIAKVSPLHWLESVHCVYVGLGCVWVRDLFTYRAFNDSPLTPSSFQLFSVICSFQAFFPIGDLTKKKNKTVVWSLFTVWPAIKKNKAEQRNSGNHAANYKIVQCALLILHIQCRCSLLSIFWQTFVNAQKLGQ